MYPAKASGLRFTSFVRLPRGFSRTLLHKLPETSFDWLRGTAEPVSHSLVQKRLTLPRLHVNWHDSRGATRDLENKNWRNYAAEGIGNFGFLGLATIPALAQVSISPMASKTASVRPAFQHAPMKFHLVRPDGSVESANWSGYAVTGSDFTNATGSWTVSAVNCTKTPDTYSAFWVGIDGYSSDTVEQTEPLDGVMARRLSTTPGMNFTRQARWRSPACR